MAMFGYKLGALLKVFGIRYFPSFLLPVTKAEFKFKLR